MGVALTRCRKGTEVMRPQESMALVLSVVFSTHTHTHAACRQPNEAVCDGIGSFSSFLFLFEGEEGVLLYGLHLASLHHAVALGCTLYVHTYISTNPNLK